MFKYSDSEILDDIEVYLKEETISYMSDSICQLQSNIRYIKSIVDKRYEHDID